MLEVVEDVESRPHKAVTFSAERDIEFQVWREQKMPKASLRHSGGRLPGRIKIEEGRDEEKEEEDGQEKKMDNEVIREILAGVPKEADAVGGGVTQKAFVWAKD